MATEWWWFLVVNAIVAAIAVLSLFSVAPRPQALPSSPGPGASVTRRASSAVLQRLHSFSIFSFPSGCFHATGPFLQPGDAPAARAADATEDTAVVASPIKSPSPARVLVLPPPVVPAPAPLAQKEDEEDEDGMSMDEAYALVVAARQRPEAEREAEARRSEVDAKAEELLQGFKDDLRQQRLNSIFNYTQMLKQRALGRGRPD